MEYVELTTEVYKQLVAKGYRYLIRGFEHLDDTEVGFENGSTFAHFEVAPAKIKPALVAMDKGEYHDIDSPEAVDLFWVYDECYFWINKKYL